MDFRPSDTAGTDDDVPPSHPTHTTRGGRASGNGRAAVGATYGRPTAEQQIRKLEQEAYTAVLRAFGAQSENITWAKERLMSDLRKELRVSDEQHRDFLGKVARDATLREIREWRPSREENIGPPMNAPPIPDAVPSPTVSVSRKKQKTTQVSQATLPLLPPPPTLKSAPVPSCFLTPSAPGKRPTLVGSRVKKSKGGRQQPMLISTTPRPTLIDPWIGRRVKTRWPEDNAFYEAVITDYNPGRGLHALTYDMNTAEEAWEWVNLKELSPRDLMWVDAAPVAVSGKRTSRGGAVAGRGGTGRGSKKAGGRGGLVSHAGRARVPPKNTTSPFEKASQPVVPTRTRKSLAPSNNGLEGKGPCQIQLPPLDVLVKEVDKIAEEADLAKLESAKRAAKEHEEMIRKALAEVGESSDDGESDDEGQAHLMNRERERQSRQDSREQHGDDEDDTAVDGRCEGSDQERTVGEGGAASDAEDDHQAEEADDADEDR